MISVDNSKHFYFPILLFSLLVIVLAFISKIEYSWADWSPATCLSTKLGCFCEMVRDGTVKQPVNAWSSLAFTLLGFLTLAHANVDKRNRSTIPGNNAIPFKYIYAVIFSISMIVIGLGSAFFHASLSFVGQTFDVMGMYIFSSFFIVYNLSRLYSIKTYLVIILFGVLNFILVYLLIAQPVFRRYAFGATLLAGIFLEIKIRWKKKWDVNARFPIYAFFIMLFSFGIWLLDTYKIVCYPSSLFQLHAFWHFGGAIAAGYLYFYFRSENNGLVKGDGD